MNSRTLVWRSTPVLGAALALSLIGASVTAERADAFTACSIASVGGAAQSGTTLTMNDGTTATIAFTCTGATSAPTLAPEVAGGPVSVGPATSSGPDSWSFSITAAPRAGGSSLLRFTEPTNLGAALQSIQVYVNVVSTPGPTPGQSTPSRTADCTSLGEPGPGNTTTQLPVEVKRPGESSFSPVPAEAMCATVTLRSADGQVGMHVYPGPAVNYDWYPKGTVYRFTGMVPGFQPDMAGGGLKGVRLITSGEQFTVEAEPIEHAYGLDQSRKCTGPYNPAPIQFAGNMASNSRLGAPPAFAGMTTGSNGTSARSPYKTANGVAWAAEGCGDNDPSTKEGFYDAFIPPALLETFGVTQDQINGAAAVADLFEVRDNGAEASGATFTKEKYQDGRFGVRIYYAMSFSSASDGTARARIAQADPSSHTIEVTRRGGPAPAAPSASPPSRPSVKWKATKKKRTVTATVKLAAGSNVTHGISAKKLRAKKAEAGKCVVDRKKTKAVCTVKLGKGRWTVSVTPRVGTLAGSASSKTFKF